MDYRTYTHETKSKKIDIGVLVNEKAILFVDPPRHLFVPANEDELKKLAIRIAADEGRDRCMTVWAIYSTKARSSDWLHGWRMRPPHVMGGGELGIIEFFRMTLQQAEEAIGEDWPKFRF